MYMNSPSAEAPEPRRPDGVLGVYDKELAHELPKAFCAHIRVRLAPALDFGELGEPGLDKGALVRIPFAAALVLRAHCGRLRAGEQPALVQPVVQAVLVGQDEVHVRGVVRDGAGGIGVLFRRVEEAALLARLGLRLIHGLEQEDEKGHVVGQRHAREPPVTEPERAAEAAVAVFVARELLRRERRAVCDNIAEHQVFLMNELPHLRQTILILPLPFGTRRSVRHIGQRKNL